MKRLGIVAHSAEGGALCFITACREGQRVMGPHLHPEIVVGCPHDAEIVRAWERERGLSYLGPLHA